VAIDATVGGETANSYVSVSAATAFFAGELDAVAWDAADTATKERALRAATTMLEALDYIGARATTTQALRWPRQVGVSVDERPVSTTAMPPRLVRATCRLALGLLTEPPEIVRDAQSIKMEKVGPIQTEYVTGADGAVERVGLQKYPLVLTELAPLRAGAFGHAMGTVVRA
jgi:hypothetical protein